MSPRLSDLNFDQVIRMLTDWVGRRVDVQVQGPTEPVLNAEGDLRLKQEGHDLSLFSLDPKDDVVVWLWRKEFERAIWVDNEKTALSVVMPNLAVTFRLRPVTDSA